MVKRYIAYQDLPHYGVPPYTRKHLLDLMRRGQFPLSRQLSANRVGWDEDEVRLWAASRPVARSLREAADGL